MAVAGNADTSYISVPDVGGKDSTIDSVRYITTTEPIIVIPDYVDNTITIKDSTIQGVIRATAYPYLKNDTLKINLPIEWNLKPRPIEYITRIDTLRIIDSIFVEKEIPFIEKPGVVATGVSIGWILLIILL